MYILYMQCMQMGRGETKQQCPNKAFGIASVLLGMDFLRLWYPTVRRNIILSKHISFFGTNT